MNRSIIPHLFPSHDITRLSHCSRDDIHSSSVLWPHRSVSPPGSAHHSCAWEDTHIWQANEVASSVSLLYLAHTLSLTHTQVSLFLSQYGLTLSFFLSLSLFLPNRLRACLQTSRHFLLLLFAFPSFCGCPCRLTQPHLTQASIQSFFGAGGGRKENGGVVSGARKETEGPGGGRKENGRAVSGVRKETESGQTGKPMSTEKERKESITKPMLPIQVETVSSNAMSVDPRADTSNALSPKRNNKRKRENESEETDQSSSLLSAAAYSSSMLPVTHSPPLTFSSLSSSFQSPPSLTLSPSKQNASSSAREFSPSQLSPAVSSTKRDSPSTSSSLSSQRDSPSSLSNKIDPASSTSSKRDPPSSTSSKRDSPVTATLSSLQTVSKRESSNASNTKSKNSNKKKSEKEKEGAQQKNIMSFFGKKWVNEPTEHNLEVSMYLLRSLIHIFNINYLHLLGAGDFVFDCLSPFRSSLVLPQFCHLLKGVV